MDYEELLKEFASELKFQIDQQKDPAHIAFMTANALKGNFSQADLTEVKGYYGGLKTARTILQHIICNKSYELNPEDEGCDGCEFREICELMGFDTGGGE